jgi:hypothetical protein
MRRASLTGNEVLLAKLEPILLLVILMTDVCMALNCLPLSKHPVSYTKLYQVLAVVPCFWVVLVMLEYKLRPEAL